jgi:soluble lytic murein transglycosylase
LKLELSLALVLALTAGGPAAGPKAQQEPTDSASQSNATTLLPTDHPRVPRELSQLWMVPDKGRGVRTAALDSFVSAVKLEIEGDYAKALPILSQPSLLQGPLINYAEYYKALAELRLGHPDDARLTFQALQAREPVGYLMEAAALREAECDEVLGDQAAALAIYERLSATKTTAPDDVLIRVGRAAKATGDLEKAKAAFARVYYEFPFSDLSSVAGAEIDWFYLGQPIAAGSNRYKLELGRAERLFGGKKYAQARTAFEGLRSAAQGDDRELVNLRLAESDYFLKRPRNARDGLRPYLDRASRQAEALFFHAVSVRELGQHDEYLKTVRYIVANFPSQSWVEEALNNLATDYILQDDDESADRTFRELYEKFPTGRYAERAAWKIGWRAFRSGSYADTVRVFEKAAADFRRSDYRPPWLYWAARAHEALKEQPLAEARYVLVATDYLNSYYGRLAAAHLTDQKSRVPKRRLVVDTQTSDPSGAAGSQAAGVPFPPTAPLVRVLLGLDLYDQAIDELHYAQKVWGDSPPIEATLAWIYHQQGQAETGTRQFGLYRAAVNTMRRAYPQFMAAGGEDLPKDVLRVIFPIAYWDLIRKNAAQRNLDPYLLAALVAQESTFVRDIRSSSNAVGLMQLLPSTGRRYAKTVGPATRFSNSLLATAEPNIEMGTAYLADLVSQFGAVHFALASYNAGESRVLRWIAERPGVDQDEFIEDIPFPETQNYVKRILGTAEDYRRLYGSLQAPTVEEATDAVPAGPRVASPAPAKAKAAAPTKKKSSAAATKKKRSRVG